MCSTGCSYLLRLASLPLIGDFQFMVLHQSSNRDGFSSTNESDFIRCFGIELAPPVVEFFHQKILFQWEFFDHIWSRSSIVGLEPFFTIVSIFSIWAFCFSIRFDDGLTGNIQSDQTG